MITKKGFKQFAKAVEKLEPGSTVRPAISPKIEIGDLRDMAEATPEDSRFRSFLSGIPARVYSAHTFMLVRDLQELCKEVDESNFADSLEEAKQRRQEREAAFKKIPTADDDTGDDNTGDDKGNQGFLGT